MGKATVIPFGPQHPVLPEPLHLDLVVEDETVIEAVAQNREAMIYEASDLVYHLLVLLEATGCSIADLEKELARRHS